MSKACMIVLFLMAVALLSLPASLDAECGDDPWLTCDSKCKYHEDGSYCQPGASPGGWCTYVDGAGCMGGGGRHPCCRGASFF